MLQPNSTARAIANKTLVAAGFMPIATDALYATGIIDKFGNLNSSLDKYQQQVVTALDIFHQQLTMTMNKPFLFRKFTFETVPPNATTGIGTSDYVLNVQIIEGFRANSFFNVTYGSGPGNPIKVIPYEQFNRMYARPDYVPIGAPLWLVPLPDDGSRNTQVRLCPTPDLAYTIEGQCRYVVPQIMAGSDRIAFPYRYEHGLIAKLDEWLQTRINEGRDVSARMYAEQFIAEIFRETTGAEEEVDRQDMGFSLWGGWRRDSVRDYNPSTDVVPPYP